LRHDAYDRVLEKAHRGCLQPLVIRRNRRWAKEAGGTRRYRCCEKTAPGLRNRHRSLPPPGSRLQLAFELVEEAPIRAVGDDLLRTRLDEPQFVKTQRVIPERILGVVFAPFIVGNFTQRLQGIVIASGETTIDEQSRHTLRFGGAEVGGFEESPHYAF